MKKSLSELEKRIGVTITDKELLKNVFMHRSYLNEHRSFHIPSNEKLEFLGDSVLSLVTSMFLYKHYPDLQEGDYTDIKASIVRTESLAELAHKLDLGAYLMLSHGEENNDGRNNINILADCSEALIAAIFIDQGFQKAYDFIVNHLFKNTLDHIVSNQLYMSPKSKLQELVQARYKLLPVYEIIDETGPEHNKTFTVQLSINNEEYAQGTGSSKKHAEEVAAKKALEKFH